MSLTLLRVVPPKREPPLPPTPETSPLRLALKGASPMAPSSMELPPLPNYRPISGFTVDSSSSGVATAIALLPGANGPVLHPRLTSHVKSSYKDCSWSLCTTMHTLTAISFRLSEYLIAFVPVGGSPSSRPSSMSPFSSAFHIHQEAMDLRTTTSDQTPSRIHFSAEPPLHTSTFCFPPKYNKRPHVRPSPAVCLKCQLPPPLAWSGL
ncbi:hypothetical protein BS47DRAFT_125955 [Hydnum rufescens UP504]|uniref:Uncharacterized protein n=1 Tax=Hydnum rufescens UP504 TaxID=1448309 RepID=A0A9P6B7T3_9AGAM|nr:hypothetical protein BS47DRAFT_125955 [Hydnum rufescens UP504]